MFYALLNISTFFFFFWDTRFCHLSNNVVLDKIAQGISHLAVNLLRDNSYMYNTKFCLIKSWLQCDQQKWNSDIQERFDEK